MVCLTLTALLRGYERRARPRARMFVGLENGVRAGARPERNDGHLCSCVSDGKGWAGHQTSFGEIPPLRAALWLIDLRALQRWNDGVGEVGCFDHSL